MKYLVEENIIDYRDQVVVGTRQFYMEASSVEELQTILDNKAHNETYCYPKRCTRLASNKYKSVKGDFIPTDMRYWD